jgi:hypothetical protein
MIHLNCILLSCANSWKVGRFGSNPVGHRADKYREVGIASLFQENASLHGLAVESILSDQLEFMFETAKPTDEL